MSFKHLTPAVAQLAYEQILAEYAATGGDLMSPKSVTFYGRELAALLDGTGISIELLSPFTTREETDVKGYARITDVHPFYNYTIDMVALYNAGNAAVSAPGAALRGCFKKKTAATPGR